MASIVVISSSFKLVANPVRPIAYDVTHIAARLLRSQYSGIDKVDQAFARRIVADFDAVLVHYGLRAPRCHPPGELVELLRQALDVPERQGEAFIYRRLTGREPSNANISGKRDGRNLSRMAMRRFTQACWLVSGGQGAVPQNAVYLNVAQHLFERSQHFAWLRQRPDVQSVFLVHDLLPLDWPEYFKPGYKDIFRRRWATIREHSRALITTSHSVRERIISELSRDGAPLRPIHVEPLPAPLGDVARDAGLAAVPYFVVVGTIEPRKNHLLLLNIWRRLAEEHANPPKLVIVGGRGWENEQILDLLDRSSLLRPHICEVSNLGDLALANLMKNARGVLAPSFAEGYGLPLVEALTLNVPVIASDIAVFREVGQNCAVYRHPLDGVGWREAILALADPATPLAVSARAQAEQFRSPTWETYFQNVEGFLRSL